MVGSGLDAGLTDFVWVGGCRGAGPGLGGERRWDLRRAVERSLARRGDGGEAGEEVDGLRRRAEGMLGQALSCSRQADVEFLFDDGAKLVKGHRGLLCSASGAFEGMFQSGMVEDSTGVVRVRHVSRASFKGFLEWVYLGEWMIVKLIDGIDGVHEV